MPTTRQIQATISALSIYGHGYLLIDNLAHDRVSDLHADAHAHSGRGPVEARGSAPRNPGTVS
jgi:hypothetical protein